jgi:hypothetical protein
MKRRQFVAAAGGLALNAAFAPRNLFGTPPASLGFSFADVTTAAGIQFQHNSGAFGGKFLPETLGSGCAFLDYETTVGKTFCSSMAWIGPATSTRNPLCVYIATIATDLSPMSPAPPAWISKCMAWESPSAITTTMASPIFS